MTSLSACTQVPVTEYAKQQPALVAEAFFDGQLTAHGVVKSRSGKIIRSFDATIKAYWEEGIGTLDEDFVFDDGEEQKRIWRLEPNGKNENGAALYKATANDVTGVGNMRVAGNSLFLNYVLQVPYKGKTIELAIDDRMYLVDENTIVNESVMRKWGFRVGEILLVIKKVP